MGTAARSPDATVSSTFGLTSALLCFAPALLRFASPPALLHFTSPLALLCFASPPALLRFASSPALLRYASASDSKSISPNLKIFSSYSIGLDKNIDLGKCRAKGVQVTNTLNVLTDVAMRTALVLLRRICSYDGYLRNGKWKECENILATKLSVLVALQRILLDRGMDEVISFCCVNY